MQGMLYCKEQTTVSFTITASIISTDNPLIQSILNL